MWSNPFIVDDVAIGLLSPRKAADLAVRLIRADAAASGIPEAAIDAPLGNAPRSGVGCTVTDSPRMSRHGLVNKGTTAYLFHSGAGAPVEPFDDILLTPQGEARAGIGPCIEAGGTLDIFMFKWDGEDGRNHVDIGGEIEGTLAARFGARAGARVRVWMRNMLCGAIERFPGISLEMGGSDRAGVLSHREWSGNADMLPAFRRGRAEDKAIRSIRARLLAGGGNGAAPVYTAVSGGPGSGKTRIVLEATRTDRLAACVVYARDPAAAERIVVSLSRRRGGEGAVLVVDDCGPMHRAGIWNHLKYNKAGIDLVTIHSEAPVEGRGWFCVDKPGDGRVDVGDTGDEQIAEIISGHVGAGRSDAEIGMWVEYCRPSPRAAHVVGSNLAGGARSVIAPYDGAPVWDGWVKGPGEIDGVGYEERVTALLWLSLFTEFGLGAPYDDDVGNIAMLAREQHPGMTGATLRGAAMALRDRGVLRGGAILRIMPRILHDAMWIRWWRRYGPDYGSRDPVGGPERGGGAGEGEEKRGVDLPPLHVRYRDMVESMRSKRRLVPEVEEVFSRGGPLHEGADAGDSIR